MEEAKDKVESIYKIRRSIEEIFFKNFADKYKNDDVLNFTHIKSLMILSFEEPCSMSALSKALQIEKGSFTPVASKLINAGYVEKIRSESDKRIYLLQLTENGKELVKDIHSKHRTYLNDCIKKLDEDEKIIYFQLIEQIIKLNEKIEKNV